MLDFTAYGAVITALDACVRNQIPIATVQEHLESVPSELRLHMLRALRRLLVEATKSDALFDGFTEAILILPRAELAGIEDVGVCASMISLICAANEHPLRRLPPRSVAQEVRALDAIITSIGGAR